MKKGEWKMNNIKNEKIVESEVCAILNSIPKEMCNKLPPSLKNFFLKYNEESQKITIDFNLPFSEQNISKQAKDIIFIISYKYWLSEKERQETLKTLQLNEEKLKEKYSIEKIFSQNDTLKQSNLIEQEENKNLPVDIKKENFFVRSLKLIKAFVYRLFNSN